MAGGAKLGGPPIKRPSAIGGGNECYVPDGLFAISQECLQALKSGISRLELFGRRERMPASQSRKELGDDSHDSIVHSVLGRMEIMIAPTMVGFS